MTAFKWLAVATGKLRFRPDREAVYWELAAHIQDHKDALQARDPDLDAADAEAQAVAAMGDPEALAAALARLHQPWLGYLWRLSQCLLAAALLAAAVVTLYRFTGNIGSRPGAYIWETLTWNAASSFQARDELLRSRTVLRPERSVRAGGYTVSVREATLDAVGPGDPYSFRLLYLELAIRCGWRGEAMDLSWAISRVADSAGTVYSLGVEKEGQPWWGWVGPADWDGLAPLGQRALMTLWYVPDGVAWVDVTFGRGSLARTLRVDLTEEAAS